jgi:hypothetical protein
MTSSKAMRSLVWGAEELRVEERAPHRIQVSTLPRLGLLEQIVRKGRFERDDLPYL